MCARPPRRSAGRRSFSTIIGRAPHHRRVLGVGFLATFATEPAGASPCRPGHGCGGPRCPSAHGRSARTRPARRTRGAPRYRARGPRCSSTRRRRRPARRRAAARAGSAPGRAQLPSADRRGSRAGFIPWPPIAHRTRPDVHRPARCLKPPRCFAAGHHGAVSAIGRERTAWAPCRPLRHPRVLCSVQGGGPDLRIHVPFCYIGTSRRSLYAGPDQARGAIALRSVRWMGLHRPAAFPDHAPARSAWLRLDACGRSCSMASTRSCCSGPARPSPPASRRRVRRSRGSRAGRGARRTADTSTTSPSGGPTIGPGSPRNLGSDRTSRWRNSTRMRSTTCSG